MKFEIFITGSCRTKELLKKISQNWLFEALKINSG